MALSGEEWYNRRSPLHLLYYLNHHEPRMQSPELLQGAIRILTQDRIAVWLTCSLVVAQAALYWWFRSVSTKPLHTATVAVERLAESATHSEKARRIAADSYPQLSQAWTSVFSSDQHNQASEAGVAPEDAFSSHTILPITFNARLDAGAPGVFTAIGIVGTFIGLILGFLRVSPTDATASIQPLLGGMIVAFGNSLVGVTLSIFWSVGSRRRRHAFTQACERLVAVARALRPNLGFEGRLLRQLEALTAVTVESQRSANEKLGIIASNLTSLQGQTRESSQQLLDNLSSSVGDAFKAMVSMPFDRLQDSVLQFDEVVKATSDRHQEIQHHFESAAARLQDAEAKLTAGIQLARECVEEFSVATMQLREGAINAGVIVEKTHDAAEAITRSAAEVHVASERYQGVSAALGLATTGMNSSASAMRETAADLAASTAQLEAALSTIRQASDDTIEHSAAAVRREMDEAVRVLVDGMREMGQQTVSAYETSSSRVVSTVDVKMSDLTERLSAELTTLASRLPEHVEGLNQSMIQIRNQIKSATSSMDNAVKRLADQTPEVLNKTLDTYDRVLGQAMDHFSGTLLQWDARMGVFEALTAEIRRLPGASSPNSSGTAQPIPA